MKRIAAAILTLLLLVPLFGCDATKFNTKDFLTDYDQLWADLEENYPFFPVLQEKGVDVQAVREKYRPFVKNADTLEEFMDVLDLTFANLLCFAHLSLIHRDRYEILCNSVEHWLDDSFAPWATLLTDPRTAATYAALPPLQEPSGLQQKAKVTCRYYPSLSAAYFHFPVMTVFGENGDETLIADYLATLPEVEHIIIDVTGNGGGSSAYWENVIVRPFGGSYSGSFAVYYQDSLINRHYYAERDLVPISQWAEVTPAFAAELNAAFVEENHWDVDFGESTLTNGADAKRWVLTDGRGYSATESFAAFCKLTGWATLVGDPTGGDGLGGNPLLLRLENTGLLVYLSTAMAANPDGSLNALRGVAPDYSAMKEKKQPLALCLQLIEEQSMRGE